MKWSDVVFDLRNIARKQSDFKAISSGDPKKIIKRFVVNKPLGRIFGKIIK